MALVDDDAVAHDARLAGALDLAVGDVAAGDGADVGHLEGLADLGVADDVLAELWREHTLHGRLDLIDGVVNDAVHPHIDVGAGRAVAGRRVGTDVEADDDGVRGGGEHDVALVDRADRTVDDAHADLVVGDLLQRGLDRLDAALHVRLDDDVQVLHLARLDLAEEILQRDLGDRRVGLGLFLRLALLDQLARQALVGDGVEVRARARHLAEARDLHGNGRTRARELLALIVGHHTHTADRRARDDDIALMERTVLHEERRDGAAALVKARLDDGAAGGAVRVGLELADLGGQRDHLEQIIHAHTGLGGDRADDGVAAPVLSQQVVLRELLLDALGVRVRLIHLVDRHDDGDAGGLGVVDGFDRLRLDAVLGGDDEDGDIRDHRAAGTHGGERLVARGIEEGDGLALDLHLIGADVLRDAAGLAGGDVRVADIVEQARLAVVDVAHDDHDGGAGLELVGGILMVVDELLLNGDDDFLLDLAAELLGDKGRGIEVDHLGKRRHDAVLHQALDDLRAGLLHAARQLADGDLVGDLDGQRGLLGDLELEAAHLLGLLLAALVGEGRRAPAVFLVRGAAELLLAGAQVVAASAAGAAALGHVLQLLIILVEVDVGGLAGIHDLLFRHAGRGLLRGGGLARRGLPRGGSRLGRGYLRSRRLRGARLCVRSRSGRGLGRARSRSGSRLRLLLLFRVGLGKDRLDLHLMVQRQIVEYDRQLTVAQHLGVTLGGLRVVLQDGNDILRLHTEVLCQTAYLVLVLRNSQYNTSKCDGTELLLLFFRAALAALDRTGIRVARSCRRLDGAALTLLAARLLRVAAALRAGRALSARSRGSPQRGTLFRPLRLRFACFRRFFRRTLLAGADVPFVRLGLPAPLGGAPGLDRELFRRFGKALVALGELPSDGLGKADVRDRQHRAARTADRAAKRVLIRSDAAPEALSRVGKVPHAAHAVFRGVGGDQNEPRIARPRRRAGRLLADGQPARLLGKADEIQKLIHRSPSPFPARRKAPA